jgi:hypothetical protein
VDDTVKTRFDSFPESVRNKLMEIRAVVLAQVGEEHIDDIVETLKWGEPSYVAKHGSTIRLGWSPKFPDHVSVFFNCNTVLIETFREIYQDTFQLVGKREIRLLLTDEVPMAALQSCLLMSLRYHKIKHLPLLGA